MHKNDAIRLRHMLEAAREAVSFAQGRSRADLKRDRMLVLSLVKAIEIVWGNRIPDLRADAG